MKNPHNPLIPMGAMTGDPSREEIRSMLRAYADAGITQYLIYPRDGCDVEYMSERWLEIVGYALEAAKDFGMDIWLYDEYNWPSGRCGGAVMRENPEYCAKRVKVTDGSCVIEPLPNYADTLSAEVTDCFLRLTHEAYYARFGAYFGSIVKGVFSDEPTYSYGSNFVDTFPYTPGMETLYAAETGRDFFADICHPDNAFISVYFRIVGRLFHENFLGRIADWCAAHGIALTGHMLAESVLHSAVSSNVNTIDALRRFQLPGMDEICTRTGLNKAEWLTFGSVQAAARVRGGGLAEVFALGPTDLPLAREEQMLWLCAMFGVDHYVLAVSAVDARGNVLKNRYFNPMNYMQPHFAGYRLLGETAARAASFARREIAPQVFIRAPFEDVSARWFPDADRKQPGAVLNSLLIELTRRQLQWQLLTNADPAPAEGVVVTVDRSMTPADVAALADRLRAQIVSPFTVTDAEGKWPDDLFVRIFADGSAVMLDLGDSPESRALAWNENGVRTPFVLSGRGHYVRGEPLPQQPETVAELAPCFSLSLDRPNTLRANLNVERLRYTFRVTQPLDGVRVLVRQYKCGGVVTLDGVRVTVDRPADALTRGLSELYASSAPLTLSAGEHTLAIPEAALGEGYLPTCLLAGSFASRVEDGTDVLSALPGSVPAGALNERVLPQYAGAITFTGALDLPAGATALRLDTAGQYTELSLDGFDLGGCISGFRWTIPEDLRGRRVTAVIRQYTSIGPIFGRAADAVPACENTGWAPLSVWFPGRYERCGVLAVTAER